MQCSSAVAPRTVSTDVSGCAQHIAQVFFAPTKGSVILALRSGDTDSVGSHQLAVVIFKSRRGTAMNLRFKDGGTFKITMHGIGIRDGLCCPNAIRSTSLIPNNMVLYTGFIW